VLLGQSDGTPTDCISMISPAANTIALFVLRPEQGDLAQAWTRPFKSFAPTILRVDLDTTYIYWPGSRGGIVEAVDNALGTTLWKSPEFASLFEGEPKRPAGDRFPVPVVGEVRVSDLVVSMDDQTLLLIERGGRVAAFDLSQGGLLWAGPVNLTRVFDVAGVNSMLVLGGLVDQEGADAPPSIVAVEKRTGQPGPAIDLTSGESAKLSPSEHIRWMRADKKGRVVVSLATGLACIDPASGSTLWDQRQGAIKGDSLVACVAGLVADNHILVLDGTQRLYMVPLDTGETQQGPLVTGQNNFSRLDFPIRLSKRGDRILLSGAKGVLVYDLEGNLVGMDALDPDLILVNPAVTQRVVATITQMRAGDQLLPGRVQAGREDAYELYFLDVAGARLVGRDELLMLEEPSEIAAIDGKVLVTVEGITFVLDVPAETNPDR
jgi:outer membrane protein assembly factor BamB